MLQACKDPSLVGSQGGASSEKWIMPQRKGPGVQNA